MSLNVNSAPYLKCTGLGWPGPGFQSGPTLNVPLSVMLSEGVGTSPESCGS